MSSVAMKRERLNTTRFQPDSSCTKLVLHALSFAHVAHAFVNGTYAGGANGNHNVKNFTLETPIPLDSGMNNISILSAMAGLPDSGAFLEKWFTGLRRVEIRCNEEQSYNLTDGYTWGYEVGLKEEDLQIYKEDNLGSVVWNELEHSARQPLTFVSIAMENGLV